LPTGVKPQQSLIRSRALPCQEEALTVRVYRSKQRKVRSVFSPVRGDKPQASGLIVKTELSKMMHIVVSSYVMEVCT